MTVLELLKEPESWVKYVFACDKNGIAVSYHNPEATRYCLSGALLRVYNDAALSVARIKVRNVLAKRYNTKNIAYANDSLISTHGELLSVLKEAGV